MTQSAIPRSMSGEVSPVKAPDSSAAIVCAAIPTRPPTAPETGSEGGQLERGTHGHPEIQISDDEPCAGPGDQRAEAHDHGGAQDVEDADDRPDGQQDCCNHIDPHYIRGRSTSRSASPVPPPPAQRCSALMTGSHAQVD